mmetsp:Transcript_18225/g.29643  ORF Transcript_18225/g.29643 Transcript_18225/m.29643 type:complete len:343 (-) Transcript_18225:646-1674(-)
MPENNSTNEGSYKTLALINACDQCSRTAVVVSQIAGCLGAFISILGILFILWFWRRPIVLLSQRYFVLGVFAAGAIASGFRPLLSMRMSSSFDSVPICFLDTFTLFPPVNVMITMITVKEFRVYYVFKQASLLQTARNIAPLLYLYVFLSLVLSTIIVILMYILAPTQGRSFFAEEVDQLVWVAPCESDPTREHGLNRRSFTVVLLVQLFFQSIIMLVVAYKARNVPSVAGESMAMFIISIIINSAFGVAFVTYFVFWDNVRFLFNYTTMGYGWGEAFMALGLMIVNVVTVYLLAFRKYISINESKNDIHSKFGFGASPETPSITNASPETTKVSAVCAENA